MDIQHSRFISELPRFVKIYQKKVPSNEGYKQLSILINYEILTNIFAEMQL